MLETIIGSLLTSLTTGLVIWYSEIKSNERLKKRISGRYVLKANLAYKIVGVICTVIGIILINLMIYNWNEELLLIAPLTVGMFLIPGIFILMFYYNYEIEFDHSRIIATNWKGSKKILDWNQIVKIKFSPVTKLLSLQFKSGNIYINQDSVGFIHFLEVMQSKTNYTVENLKMR